MSTPAIHRVSVRLTSYCMSRSFSTSVLDWTLLYASSHPEFGLSFEILQTHHIQMQLHFPGLNPPTPPTLFAPPHPSGFARSISPPSRSLGSFLATMRSMSLPAVFFTVTIQFTFSSKWSFHGLRGVSRRCMSSVRECSLCRRFLGRYSSSQSCATVLGSLYPSTEPYPGQVLHLYRLF